MARKFLTAIDLAKNELQNAAVQNLASAPAAPVKGQLYYNSTGGDDTLYWWNGTTWIPAKAGAASSFGTVVPETTFGGTSADGTAGTYSRSDHKHANPLHDNAAHSTIPINALAGATGPIDMNGFVISEVGTPVAPTDAANKGYVDNAIAGLSWKDSVRVASTAQVALTGLTAIDGVTPVAGDRILLKAQTAPAENGIWVAAAAAWSRSTDADLAAEILGAAVYVEEGTTMADTAWVMTTNAPITLGTTALVWSQFAGGGAVTAGAGMTQAGNVLNVIAADATMVVAADSIARAALTGEVTTAVNVATITNDAVTNAKLANMPVATIKGRVTAGTGDPEDLTPAQVGSVMAGVLMRKYAVNIGGATSVIVSHNLNTTDILAGVYRNSGAFEQVECDIECTSSTTITVRFAVAPAANEYRCVVIG